MNIDLGTLLVGLISVGVFALPFVLTIRSRKRKRKKLMASISAMSDRYNTKIGESEFCGNYAIGIDPEHRFVFFHKKYKDRVEEQTVVLLEVKSCRPLNHGSNVAGDRIIERLGLQFAPKDKDKPEIILEFYNDHESYQLSGELQSMERWAKLIDESLKG
jgi:hypothetical protein